MTRNDAKRTTCPRTRARDLNPNLGRAYDLLRRWRVIFYNDAVSPWLPAGVKRPVTGRSLKPLVVLTPYQHRTIAALADKVTVTRPYRTTRGMEPGGERRYHFDLTRPVTEPMYDMDGGYYHAPEPTR